MRCSVRTYLYRGLVQTLVLISALCLCSRAYAESISLISDEETESFIREIVRPLYRAANISFNPNDIYIVNDPSLNAFVADGNAMFVHTGTLVQADNYNQVVGVLAHETGHIQGGHILRQKLKLQNVQQATLASLIAAGVAGAVSGRPDVGMAIMLGSQTSALHNIIAYRVQEERSADEAAVQLLGKTGQSPAGLRDFMKKIQQQNVLSGIEETPYFRTHPVTSERLTFMTKAAKGKPFVPDEQLSHRFEMVRAKLTGFLSDPRQTFKIYPTEDTSSPALYAQAIALFKQLRVKEALQKLDILIGREQKNPYLYELKAQILLETGQVAPAVREYKKAYRLLPSSPLIQESLAQAMLENNPSSQEVDEIINLLNKALIRRPDSYAWLLLARAYGIKGDKAYANYASAEFSYRIRSYETAQKQVETALKASPSPALTLKLNDLSARLKDKLNAMPPPRYFR